MSTRIGIVGTADIALRRFLPALASVDDAEYVGVASRDVSRTAPFVEQFGGRAYGSYEDLLADADVDAVYLPLPPALHHEWARRALAAGKHVLLEKPATVTLAETESVLREARSAGRALTVNYMYAHHAQLKAIRDLVDSGEVGAVRGLRTRFGFPMRPAGDFRYRRDLGGGALLDCGCYTLHLAGLLVGPDARVTSASLHPLEQFDVDVFGAATVQGGDGVAVQVAFGMDNDYRCELEVWGEKGSLLATRIFSAGAGFVPEAVISSNGTARTVALPADDQFRGSIEHFLACAADEDLAAEELLAIRRQSSLIEQVRRLATVA